MNKLCDRKPWRTTASERMVAESLPARARAFRAPAVDRRIGQIDVAPTQLHELGGAQPMTIGDEDHCVVAHAVAGTLLGGAKKGDDFVAGEVVAQAGFAGHERNLPQTPSPSSPRREPRA